MLLHITKSLCICNRYVPFVTDKASSSSARSTRQTATALGNLADMAARSATLGTHHCLFVCMSVCRIWILNKI